MKKNLAAISLVAVIAICMMVVYKNLATVQDDGYRSSRERATIKKFDKDGDGELNKEELKAAKMARAKDQEKRKQEYIEKFDKDGDGKLSKEERQAIERASEERKMEWMKKFDKDGDGELNKEEREAAGKKKRQAAGKTSDR